MFILCHIVGFGGGGAYSSFAFSVMTVLNHQAGGS